MLLEMPRFRAVSGLRTNVSEWDGTAALPPNQRAPQRELSDLIRPAGSRTASSVEARFLGFESQLEAEKPMCEKCAELDGRIKRYRWIVASISDQLTITRIKELIAKLEAGKAELHPEQQK